MSQEDYRDEIDKREDAEFDKDNKEWLDKLHGEWMGAGADLMDAIKEAFPEGARVGVKNGRGTMYGFVTYDLCRFVYQVTLKHEKTGRIKRAHYRRVFLAPKEASS